MFANYEYTLTGEDQAEIQLFLRMLPTELRDFYAARLLHALTYAESWTAEPKYEVVEIDNDDRSLTTITKYAVAK
jgi:hypothetical protein